MREPDIRCEWRSSHWESVCGDHAHWSAQLATWTSIALCEKHRRVEQPRHTRTRFLPLIREPRVAACVVGALTGATPEAVRALLAGDAASLPVALDLVEEMGLHDGTGAWPPADRPVVDKHGTGDNPHVWLPYRPKNAWTPEARAIAPEIDTGLRQCTCGLFEHEAERALVVDDPDDARPARADAVRNWYERRIGR